MKCGVIFVTKVILLVNQVGICIRLPAPLCEEKCVTYSVQGQGNRDSLGIECRWSNHYFMYDEEQALDCGWCCPNHWWDSVSNSCKKCPYPDQNPDCSVSPSCLKPQDSKTTTDIPPSDPPLDHPKTSLPVIPPPVTPVTPIISQPDYEVNTRGTSTVLETVSATDADGAVNETEVMKNNTASKPVADGIDTVTDNKEMPLSIPDQIHGPIGLIVAVVVLSILLLGAIIFIVWDKFHPCAQNKNSTPVHKSNLHKKVRLLYWPRVPIQIRLEVFASNFSHWIYSPVLHLYHLRSITLTKPCFKLADIIILNRTILLHCNIMLRFDLRFKSLV